MIAQEASKRARLGRVFHRYDISLEVEFFSLGDTKKQVIQRGLPLGGDERKRAVCWSGIREQGIDQSGLRGKFFVKERCARKIEIAAQDDQGICRHLAHQIGQLLHLAALDPRQRIVAPPIPAVIGVQVCVQDQYFQLPDPQLGDQHTFIKRPIGEGDQPSQSTIPVRLKILRGQWQAGKSAQASFGSVYVGKDCLVRIGFEAPGQERYVGILLDFLKADDRRCEALKLSHQPRQASPTKEKRYAKGIQR